ncbi:hypothetical protein [Terrabacter sp. MAHUQ-38]|uniref:hypothetical protein n=1 Tax=unclassified Terrabacter TaxID=2630222 RepID=UPI00165E0EB3|nr:hypothetical protein [Terrabacter sp. MAHUQ-38]MBC9820508.1 hypothetical protein [Terrabacter sp. MAHUQ-38]
MAAPQWVFDPVPPSGALSGGDPKSYLFSPNIDSLVREVVQNATDQQAGDDAVHVRFTLHELAIPDRDSFLAALDWPRLREHLRGVAASDSLINGRVSDALNDIDSGRLLVLQIEDSGTRGLTGPEDGTAGNFAALCKHVLVTNDDKAAKGGSYGLGKAVLWRFSALETVLFGSAFHDEKGDQDHRLFGRTELPFHDAENGKWAGPGWFGVPEQLPAGRRARSVREAEAAQRGDALLVGREAATGTGTTALIVGFSEPASERPRTVPEVVHEIALSAAKWFWPRLGDGSLVVSARGYVGGDPVIDELADPALVDPGYIVAVEDSVTGYNALSSGDVAEKPLEFRVPRLKTDTGSGEVEGHVTLRLARVDDDRPADTSTVALVRGAGMVVKYHRVPGIPLQGGGYRAVLLAGTRHGSDPSDAAIEEFLRSAEPPEHDDWVHHTNALRSHYRPGGKARLDELWGKIRMAVMEMTSSKPGGSEKGPELLAKHFQVGGRLGSQSQRHRFLVDFGRMRFDGHEWTIEGRARRTAGDKAWHVDIGAALAGESVKVPMQLVSATADVGTVVLERGKERARVTLPNTSTSVRFVVVARPHQEDAALAMESTLRVEALPREEV